MQKNLALCDLNSLCTKQNHALKIKVYLKFYLEKKLFVCKNLTTDVY